MYMILTIKSLFICDKFSTCCVLFPSPQGEGLGVRSKNQYIKYLPYPSPLLKERGLLPAT